MSEAGSESQAPRSETGRGRRGEVSEIEPGVWEWRAPAWGMSEWVPIGTLTALFQMPLLVMLIRPAPAPGAASMLEVSLFCLGLSGVFPLMFLLLAPRRIRLDRGGVTVRWLFYRRRHPAHRIMGVWFPSPPSWGLRLVLHGPWRDRSVALAEHANAADLTGAALERFGLHPRLQELMRRASSTERFEWRGRATRLGFYSKSAAWIMAGCIVAAGSREYVWPVLTSTGDWLAMVGLVAATAVAGIGLLNIAAVVSVGPPIGLSISDEGIELRRARDTRRIASADILGAGRGVRPGVMTVMYREGERVRTLLIWERWFRGERFEIAAALLAKYGEVWPGAWCGRCAYELRGVTEEKCPECGISLREPLARQRPGKTVGASPIAAAAAYYHAVLRRKKKLEEE